MSGRLGKIAMNFAETDQAGYDGFVARKAESAGIQIPGA